MAVLGNIVKKTRRDEIRSEDITNQLKEQTKFLPDVLCNPTVLIWREVTRFEAMTDCTAFIDVLLVEVFQGFP